MGSVCCFNGAEGKDRVMEERRPVGCLGCNIKQAVAVDISLKDLSLKYIRYLELNKK